MWPLSLSLRPIRDSLTPMNDIGRLFQAFVAPAIFFSATALFILSINVRLMGIVSRLRQYMRSRHEAVKNGHLAEAEACTAQIESMEQRAEMIRRTSCSASSPLSAPSCPVCSSVSVSTGSPPLSVLQPSSSPR